MPTLLKSKVKAPPAVEKAKPEGESVSSGAKERPKFKPKSWPLSTVGNLLGCSLHDSVGDDELAEDIFNMYSTIALVAALILSFEFSVAGETIDTSKICGACATGGECSNIFKSCSLNETLSEVYTMLIMLSATTNLMCVLFSMAHLLNFAVCPKNMTKEYMIKVGALRLDGPYHFMQLAEATFGIAMALQVLMLQKTGYGLSLVLFVVLVLSPYYLWSAASGYKIALDMLCEGADRKDSGV